ncbi:MAG: HisA/HisF-related TIM barrel protein [Promethearchaeota archaeon]|jgi:phosphoribosylformimino-5-aminoimidazole carboxamide ribotide isomerase
MNKFKVIPVLDILNSEAVHAVKGERNSYKPLTSKLFNSHNPVEILQLLISEYGFYEFYIADLDAIVNNNPNFQLLTKILRIPGIKIMIDPGIVNSKDILLYSKYKINNLIIGLEKIHNLAVIQEGLNLLGEGKIIVSIDMYKGKILAKNKELSGKNPIKIVKQINLISVKEIILLDLFRVGQKIGDIPSQYHDIQKIFDGNIYVGGGIKNYKDILKYKQNNFSGILIATALYDGTIGIEKLSKFII